MDEVKKGVYHLLADLGIVFVFLFIVYLVIFQINVFYSLGYLFSANQTPSGTAFSLFIVALSLLLIYFPRWLWKKYHESIGEAHPAAEEKDNESKAHDSADKKRMQELELNAERMRKKAIEESEAQTSENKRKTDMVENVAYIPPIQTPSTSGRYVPKIVKKQRSADGSGLAIKLIDSEQVSTEAEGSRKRREISALRSVKMEVDSSLKTLKEAKSAFDHAIRIARRKYIVSEKRAEMIAALELAKDAVEVRIAQKTGTLNYA